MLLEAPQGQEVLVLQMLQVHTADLIAILIVMESISWDGIIDPIDNDTYYNNIPTTNIFYENNHTNGIDIYLYPADPNYSTPIIGLANGVGMSSEFYIVGRVSGIPACTTSTISHEMGHVLNLWHTHHGTYDEGGNDNPCVVRGATITSGGNTNSPIFTMNPNGTVRIGVRARNACGWGPYTYLNGGITNDNGQTPINSPGNNIVNIPLPEDGEYEITLWNNNRLIRTVKTTQSSYDVDLNNLPPDLYIIKVAKDGKRIYQLKIFSR
jgi:hypothetical protein